MKRKPGNSIYFIGILILCLLIVFTETFLFSEYSYSNLTMSSNETAAFRNFQLSEAVVSNLELISREYEIPIPELITILMIKENYSLEKLSLTGLNKSELKKEQEKIEKRKGKEFSRLLESYEAILKDLKYFPVPASNSNEDATVRYEDSWMYERTFGGKRGHEGTDVMAGINQRGYYPLVSITDGTIEKIGWLTQGGYRIGIRAESGAYFYYAHLSEYSSDFQEGERIEAGELIGFMGDTGYSEIEGTTGNFDVHLHLGIYVPVEGKGDVSINPYWVLKYLENRKLNYSY